MSIVMPVEAQGVADALSNEGTHGNTALRLAQAQDSEGIRINDATWAWVTCFIDLDYEYGYLVDVRYNDGDGATTSDYLAIFDGIDHTGARKVSAEWQGRARRFPEIPDLYSAIAWWGEWLYKTRVGD